MNNKKHSKVPLIIGLTILASVLFTFLVFETDAIFNVDISTYYSLNQLLRKPISVAEIERAKEANDNTGPPSGGLPGGTTPTPNPPGPSNPNPPTGNFDLATVDGRRDYIYAFLTDRGYCEEAICGIMGNMWTETGGTFDPATTSSAGYVGICQWGAGRKTNLQSRADWNTLPVQLDFMMDEINSIAGYRFCKVDALNDCYNTMSSIDPTISGASDRIDIRTFVFLKYYEGAIISSYTGDRYFAYAAQAYQGWSSRQSHAHEIDNLY